MRFGWAMTSLAGDSFSLERRYRITVKSAANGLGLPGMAKKAFWRHRSIEIGRTCMLVSRRHVPDSALRVPGDRRLEEMVTHRREKSDGVIPGTDDVCNFVVRANTIPFELLNQPRPIPSSGEPGF
ncbi:MAG TPA: hypothetical protein VGK64_28795 [Bryobacteraceae bacterium]